LKILIAGLGSIGMRHARNFQVLGASVELGVDPSEERRARFVREIGGEAFASLEEGLTRSPTLVVVASPSRFHVQQATLCVLAGCDLLIEKPIGTSDSGVAALKAAIAASKRFVHVGSNFKFHSAFREMRRLLDENSLGQVTGAQVLAGQWLPDWHPWEDYRLGYSAQEKLGGGIVFDTHEFDYLMWLLGPIDRIEGFSTSSGCLEIETEDVACACMRFASGVLATLQVDYIQRDYRRRYHISGDGGTMEWDYTTGRIDIFRAGSGERQVLDVREDINTMYLRQAQHVLDGVTSRIDPVTPVEHAQRVLELQSKIRSTRV
jgi:predicted dehydrogenase